MNDVKLVDATQSGFAIGSIWRAPDDCLYILSGSINGYACINLASGNHWDEPNKNIEAAVKKLTLVARKAEITVKAII